jgi:hypothetical protein
MKKADLSAVIAAPLDCHHALLLHPCSAANNNIPVPPRVVFCLANHINTSTNHDSNNILGMMMLLLLLQGER